MSVLQTLNQFGNTAKRKELEEDFFTHSYQSMFAQRTEKDGLASSGLYGSSVKHPSFPQNMSNMTNMSNMAGLTSGFQGMSLHSSSVGSRGMNSNAQFGRSNTAPAGYSNISGMQGIAGMSGISGMAGMTGMTTGVSPFGAPSPPPQRNNLFVNNMNPVGSQGLTGVAKQHPTSRPNALASAINSGLPVNSYGGLGNTGGGRISHMTPFGSSLVDPTQGAFDPSEFPVLGTRPQQDPGFNSRPLVGKVSTESSQEFQMRVEDFPSLPGSSSNKTTAAAESNETILQQEQAFTQTSSANVIPENRTSSSLTYDPAPGSNKERSMAVTKQTTTRKAVTVPVGMVQDHYGMMGLLTFIKGAETDPNLVALALGSDLTTLGLNLNSPESLYSTFSSPFADSPSRPQDIDYVVPQEYLIHSYIRDKLAPIRLSKYNEDLLFYLYYTSGGDLLQLLAAHELYSRDWRYHKEDKIWITRAPGMRPSKVEQTHEEGTYCYFDVNTWRKCHKDMKVEYDKLSERPQIPPAFTSQQIVSSVPV